MDWKYDYLTEQLNRTAYKKHEAYIIGSLIHDPRLADLKPMTQHYVRRKDSGYALIDLFYPQINIAIEIDEPHHRNNRENDSLRQVSVEDSISCLFRRISVSDGNVVKQINNLKEFLINEKERLNQNETLAPWTSPRVADIENLKTESKNTLFIKIRGEIPPEQLLARQTGYWRIDKNKSKQIDMVVIVHDGVVTRTFHNVTFHNREEGPKKMGFTGNENEEHALVGTHIKGWISQQTITYSNDVYKSPKKSIKPSTKVLAN